MNAPRATALLAILAGCGTLGLEPSETDTAVSSDEEALASLRIDAITPTAAPLGGGTDVTISGAGFTGAVQFWFGNSEVTATVLDPQTVVVTTPEVFVEATVDVKLRAAEGEVILPAAFTFTDSATGGTGSGTGGGTGSGSGSGGSGSGSGGSGGSGTGLVSGRVEFGAIAVGCPDCFGLPLTYTGTEAVFHTPQNVDWLQWLPAQGSCQLNPVFSDPVGSSMSVGGSVVLQTSGASVTFSQTSRDGLTVYQSPTATFDDYLQSSTWDLVVNDGGSLGPHTVSGAMVSTPGFSDIQPISILNDSFSAFPYISVGAGASFGWSPAGVSDGIVIDVLVFDSLTGNISGEILCYANDTGSFVVPADKFGTFYVDDLVGIFLYRLEETSAVSPVDGSTIQGISSLGVLGSGTLTL